jgi:hypothetical protein
MRYAKAFALSKQHCVYNTSKKHPYRIVNRFNLYSAFRINE